MPPLEKGHYKNNEDVNRLKERKEVAYKKLVALLDNPDIAKKLSI